MLYFAYGSNMSTPRLQARLPHSEIIGAASLKGFQLRFHKKGVDGSAKADALYTGKERDLVLGALYQLSDSEILLLDQIEDSGVGYERICVQVEAEGKRYQAWTYVALHIDRSLLPFDWYHHHVLHGAKMLELPTSYLEIIQSFSHACDKDKQRAERELSVYSR